MNFAPMFLSSHSSVIALHNRPVGVPSAPLKRKQFRDDVRRLACLSGFARKVFVRRTTTVGKTCNEPAVSTGERVWTAIQL